MTPLFPMKSIEALGSLKHATRYAQIAQAAGKFLLSATQAGIRLKDAEERRRYFINNTSEACSDALQALNIHVNSHGVPREALAEQPHFIVSNHLSYLDIFVLSSVLPSIYVTSVEMRTAFLLGKMAEAGGSLFVERRSPGRLAQDLRVVQEVLGQGFHLTVFPEGSTSNGETVQSFKRGLFRAAVQAEASVLPVCIRYRTINNETFGPENRDLVCWYGDQPFFSHFLNLRKIQEAEVDVHYLDPIQTNQQTDVTELVKDVHQQITDRYHARPEN